jgi:hypothetical protein
MLKPDITDWWRRPAGLRARLLWFVGLWAASVLAITLVATVIQWVLTT